MGRLRFWLFLSIIPALCCHFMAQRRAKADGFQMGRPVWAVLLGYYVAGIHLCFALGLHVFEDKLPLDDVVPAATVFATALWYISTRILLRCCRTRGMLQASYRSLVWRVTMLMFLTPEYAWIEQAVWSFFGGEV